MKCPECGGELCETLNPTDDGYRCQQCGGYVKREPNPCGIPTCEICAARRRDVNDALVRGERFGWSESLKAIERLQAENAELRAELLERAEAQALGRRLREVAVWKTRADEAKSDCAKWAASWIDALDRITELRAELRDMAEAQESERDWEAHRLNLTMQEYWDLRFNDAMWAAQRMGYWEEVPK